MKFNDKQFVGEIMVDLKDNGNGLKGKITLLTNGHAFIYTIKCFQDLKKIWGKSVQNCMFYEDLCRFFPQYPDKSIELFVVYLADMITENIKISNE